MNTNPYAPPIADVGDVAPETRAPRPAQVVWAVRLLWLTALCAIPQFYFEATQAQSAGAMMASVIFETVVTLFAAFLYVCIYRGRNWARIVTLVLTVLSTAMVVFGHALAHSSTFEQVFTWLNTVSDIVCMGLLFTSAASRWFRPSAAAPASPTPRT